MSQVLIDLLQPEIEIIMEILKAAGSDGAGPAALYPPMRERGLNRYTYALMMGMLATTGRVKRTPNPSVYIFVK